MVSTTDVAIAGRQKGGLRAVRPGVWLIDVELPRVGNERRRRVSRTLACSEAEARAALVALTASVDGAPSPSKTARLARSVTSSRKRGSGSIYELAPDRWLVGVEGPPDPVSGLRRRHTQTVNGERAVAEVALARLKLRVDSGEAVRGTSARSVAAACDMYLAEAGTELQTIRTDRSACRRICSTMLPGGQMFGTLALAKVDWRRVEEMYAKWAGRLDPTTQARYASTLSKVLDCAKRAGWVRENVALQAKRPKVPSQKPDVPIPVDVRVALDRAREADFNLYAYGMGLATIGCRRSELLAVTVGDCDLATGVITIRASIADGGPGVGTFRKTTKRDDWRDVPLTEQMLEVLEAVYAKRRLILSAAGAGVMSPDSFVFSDEPDGSRWLRPDTTSQRWLRARGDSEVTLAMLRRYVAT